MMKPVKFKKLGKLYLAILLCSPGSTTFVFADGYYSPRNIQSFASKNIADNTIFNNQTQTLQANTTRNGPQGLPYGVGQVANTQFANTGYAGCGVSYPLMQAIYQTAGQNKNYAENYLALNVYSHLMGYDPNAPVWPSTSGEGEVKGYLNFAQGNLAYPYRQYLRSIPALYPSYLGLYDNGKSCGRWAQVNTAQEICNDNSGAAVGYASKACTSQTASSYKAKTFYGYIFDSCEDNNGWCRDDDAHLDINSASTGNNNYISWKFTSNPYYSDPSAPSQLKDVWLAWYNSPVNAWWTYIEVANLPDGLGMLQFNIGSSSHPVWVNSHYQAGGNNNMTWTEGTSNGQTWQLQPMGSNSDSAPQANPTYQIRLFDTNGYPIRNGQIYQFDLATTSKTGSQPLSGEILFYKGQPGQGSSIITAPANGTAMLTINVSNLPIALSAINPVLIDSNGFSYNPSSCTSNSCTFQKLPSATSFRLYGVYSNETSNDLVVRKSQQLTVNETGLTLNGTAATINLSAAKWDFTTTYTGTVTIPLKFNVSKPSAKSVNANLQALFVPTNTSAVTANTQGCFLNNYYPQNSTTTPTTCYLYYTAHQNGSFTSTVPNMNFTLQLPQDVGVTTADHLQLAGTVNAAIKISGYNPGSSLVIPQTVATATYQPANGSQRSLYVILDANSDAACLNNFSSVKISLGSNSPLTLTSANVDNPVSTSINSAASISGTVTMKSGANNCKVNFSQPSVTPGTDLIEMVKLDALPETSRPTPSPTPAPTISPSPTPTPGNAQCTAIVNVSTSPGWNGCNTTFDVANIGNSAISSVMLSWNGSTQSMQPWGGVIVNSTGSTILVKLPMWNPILPSSKVIGNSSGWGMTIQDSNVCSALSAANLSCKAN